MLSTEGSHREAHHGCLPGPDLGRVFGQGIKSECPIFSSPRKSGGSLGDSALRLNYAAM